MTQKLITELDINLSRKSFELIRSNTALFENWTKRELFKFCEYVKVLSFHKGNWIAKRDENIEFLGIFLSGRAFISIEAHIFGYLEAGDMIGYMNLMKIKGTETHYFDIIAEKEGYLVVVKADDLKILQRKEPFIWFKIHETIGKKCLNTIYSQFYKGKYMDKIILIPTSINQKKITDLIENCPGLRDFFNSLEKRDKKYLISSSSIIEMSSKDSIAKINTNGFLIFILKGQLISFKNENTFYHEIGKIVGKKEFLFNLSWSENYFCNQAGYLLKIDKDQFYDIVNLSPNTALQIYNYLIKTECKSLKNQRNNNFSDININNFEKNDEFIELDVEKTIEKLQEIVNKKMEGQNFEDFKLNLKISPFYIHDVFKHYVKIKNINELENKNKDKNKKNQKVFGSIFLTEKLEKQTIEAQKKKIELRSALKKGNNTFNQNLSKSPERRIERGIEEDYEELKNDFGIIQGENEILRTDLKNLNQENQKLLEEIKKLNEITIYLTCKVNKTEIQKELLSKDIASSFENLSLFSRSHNTNLKKNLSTVLNDQIILNKKYQLVAKCAYKWLFLTKKRVYSKK